RCVAPKILSYCFAHPVISRDASRQRSGEMADLAKLLHAKLLGLEEGLVHTHGKPGMAFYQRAADADGMHDGKYARLAKIGLLYSRIVREHAADVGSAI